MASFYIGDGWSQALRALRKEKRELEEQIRRLPDGEEKEELQALRSRPHASYTTPEHLREAMGSILSQAFTDFEFLI